MKVLVVYTKAGKKEEIEVELEPLLEEIVEAVKVFCQKKFKEQGKEGPCPSKD